MKKLIAIASILTVGALSVSSTLAAVPGPVSNTDLITWGHEAGLTKFDSWTAFNANAPVTREQAAKMITMWIQGHHELNWGMTEAEVSFNDEASIDPTLLYGAESSASYGLFLGHKGNFMPKNYITQADVKVLIARAANKLPDYSSRANSAPNIKGSFLTRGELLTALHHFNVVVEGQIAADKEDMLSTVWANMSAAKARWDAKDIHHYEARQQLSCFCTPNSTHPISFEVMSGMVVTGTLQDVNETDKIPASQLLSEPKTVEQMFALIQDAIDRKADSIDVEYDATLGNPTKINIDYSRMMADEEQYYTYSVKVIQ